MVQLDVPPKSSNAFASPSKHGGRAGVVVCAGLVVGLVSWTAFRVAEALASKSELTVGDGAGAHPAALAEEGAVAQGAVAQGAVAQGAVAQGAVAQQAGALPKVQVVSCETSEWRPEIELSGTLEPERKAALGFPLAGKLLEIDGVVGQEVAEGHALAILDARQVRMRVQAARAQRRLAELQLTFAAEEEGRTMDLVKRGVFAPEGGIKANRERLLAAAQLELPRTEESLASLSLEEHTLRAPFDGTLTRAPRGVGALVGAGEALFELVDTKQLRFVATATEAEASLIERGTKVWLESEQGRVEGVVRAILETLEPTTRRVPVIADFVNASGMRVGAYVRARAQAAREQTSVRIPRSALRPGTSDEVLIVAPDSRLELRKISYFVDPSGQLFVRRGLSAGEQLVAAPTAELQPGGYIESVPPTESGPR